VDKTSNKYADSVLWRDRMSEKADCVIGGKGWAANKARKECLPAIERL
jgi:hypothetical protein